MATDTYTDTDTYGYRYRKSPHKNRNMVFFLIINTICGYGDNWATSKDFVPMGKHTTIEEIFIIAKRLGSTMIARGCGGGWYIRTRHGSTNIPPYGDDGPTRRQTGGKTYICPSGLWDINNFGGSRSIEDFA